MTDNPAYRELLRSLLTDLHSEAWCWECGFRRGHTDGCRIARLVEMAANDG